MKTAPKPARLLVVDDNEGLVENLCEILDGAGYAVRGAGTCADALASARDGFDVALVDLRLPDGDGTALAPQLKDAVARTARWCSSPASRRSSPPSPRCAPAPAPTS